MRLSTIVFWSTWITTLLVQAGIYGSVLFLGGSPEVALVVTFICAGFFWSVCNSERAKWQHEKR